MIRCFICKTEFPDKERLPNYIGLKDYSRHGCSETRERYICKPCAAVSPSFNVREKIMAAGFDKICDEYAEAIRKIRKITLPLKPEGKK